MPVFLTVIHEGPAPSSFHLLILTTIDGIYSSPSHLLAALHMSLSIVFNIIRGGLINEILLVEHTLYVDVRRPIIYFASAHEYLSDVGLQREFRVTHNAFKFLLNFRTEDLSLSAVKDTNSLWS